MGIFEFLLLLLIAAICGGIGQSIGGFKVAKGGCLVSAAVGFVGAIQDLMRPFLMFTDQTTLQLVHATRASLV